MLMTCEAFELTITVGCDGLQVEVDGALDLHGARMLERCRPGLALGAGDQPLALDLGGVTFLAAAGVSALLSLSGSLPGGADQLVVTNVSWPAQKVLRLCGLEERFRVVPAAPGTTHPSPPPLRMLRGGDHPDELVTRRVRIAQRSLP